MSTGEGVVVIVGKLGLRPGDPTRPALRLGPALTGQVPAHPATADNASRITAWGMLGNQKYGDCGPAGVEHQRMQVTAYLTDTPYVATDTATLAFYQLVVPGFDPATDAGDDGVVLQDMLQVAAKRGVGGATPVAYARVDHTNLDEIRAAIALFGSVLFGVDLQVTQQNQTVWDYDPAEEWGGHCVLAVRYDGPADAADIGVVTWGEVVGCTDAFLAHQLQEAWAVIWPEHLGSAEFTAGVDLAALAADYRALTGRDLPVPPQPTPPTPPPAPAPPAGDADHELVAALGDWADARHAGANKHAAEAFKTWRTAKGL